MIVMFNDDDDNDYNDDNDDNHSHPTIHGMINHYPKNPPINGITIASLASKKENLQILLTIRMRLLA